MTKPDLERANVTQEWIGISLSRRALLGRLVITSVSMVCSLSIAPAAAAQELASNISNQLLELAVRLDLSKRVGKLYLQSPHGKEEIDKHGVLAQLVFSILEEKLDPNDPSALLPTLAKRISKDFQENRICYLEDWQLSLTECRLAALNYLSSFPPQQATESAPSLRTLASAENSVIGSFPERNFIEVLRWGPKTTKFGEGFNLQSAGQSAFWMRLPHVEDQWVFWLGGYSLRTDRSRKKKLIFGFVPKVIWRKLVTAPDVYPLYLVDYGSSLRQKIGNFTVLPE